MRESLRRALKKFLKVDLCPGKPSSQTLTYAELILTTGTEGEDYTVAEGGTYTWSDGLSYWIRKEAYDLKDANLELVAKIDGDTVPASETPAWDDDPFSWGSYTISTDGTWVKMEGWVGETMGGAFASIEVLPDGNFLWQGYVHIDEYALQTWVCGLNFYVPDGANRKYIQLNFWDISVAPEKMTLRKITETGTVVADSDTDIRGSIVFLEVVYNDSGNMTVYIDNSSAATMTAAASDFTTAPGGYSSTQVVKADSRQTMYIKDVKVIRLT